MDALFHKTHIDLNLLLCGWSKAFDRTDPKVLSDALVAYGIGRTFLQAIKSTFHSELRVLGTGGFPSSPLFPQEVGIHQGCPLSPLLFLF